jgi:hypothetical protein
MASESTIQMTKRMRPIAVVTVEVRSKRLIRLWAKTLDRRGCSSEFTAEARSARLRSLSIRWRSLLVKRIWRWRLSGKRSQWLSTELWTSAAHGIATEIEK